MKAFSASAPRLSVAQLNHEIAALPHEEREIMLRDLHGTNVVSTAAAVVESVELRCASVSSLRHEMEQLPSNDKRNYALAMERCPQHADDPEFLLQFLRSEEFNVQVRMIIFCQREGSGSESGSVSHSSYCVTSSDDSCVLTVASRKQP